jgi:hypothetical protein
MDPGYEAVVDIPGQAKEDRLPMLKWLKPGSNWRAAVLIIADSDRVDSGGEEMWRG